MTSSLVASHSQLLNLGVVNVFEVEKSRKGDFVLHDGTGFEDGEPRLAVFSGQKWLFFGITASPKQVSKKASERSVGSTADSPR